MSEAFASGIWGFIAGVATAVAFMFYKRLRFLTKLLRKGIGKGYEFVEETLKEEPKHK